MKMTRCKICRTPYKKWSISQKVCPDINCAIELMQQEKEKRARKAHAAAKVKAKTRAEWLKDTQAVVNKFIRLRDGNLCISCGRVHQGQIHAGHYLSVGAHPALRFTEININSQCSACNNYLSGNIVNYRKGLIAKIGVGKVEWLEGKHEPAKFTIPELIEIKQVYAAKCKALSGL